MEYKTGLEEIIPVTQSHLRLTSIVGFKTKQHYFELLEEIINFINRKEPANASEQKFLGINDISKLYEWFCLFKIFEVINEKLDYEPLGFDLNQLGTEARYSEDLFTENLLSYKSYQFLNRGKQSKITIYYECLPGNFSDIRNGRNKNRPIRLDFFIEIEDIINGIKKYLILDAKYKTASTIASHEYQDLTLKYLHGIAPTNKSDFKVIGLFMLHPKSFINKISYYQEYNYSLEGKLPIYPSIGSLEVSTNNIEYLLKLFTLSLSSE